MSRIGKQLIPIPNGVQFTVSEQEVRVKGPKGELVQALHPLVRCMQENGTIFVSVLNPDEKNQRALWGLFQRLVANMVQGVTVGFSKSLEVNGVGFKVAVSGNQLTLSLGFSHPVTFVLPQGVIGMVEKNVITVSGADKQVVGETAARIRALKKPEPYKGKGIKYTNESIRRKAGKAGKAGGKK
ncbi:50S ribosomal protein L6 [Candidatus Uhrbacteria bacterium]|nr:50S ribosomal protein L6 [Candidatus Uhrbacteria bacterium]